MPAAVVCSDPGSSQKGRGPGERVRLGLG
jgi:hypothetical protein